MSYTTRCPACGTTFRVVPDQLKISDGWVRCGHCADVFDATLYLEPWTPPPEPTVALVPEETTQSLTAPPAAPAAPAMQVAREPDPQPTGSNVAVDPWAPESAHGGHRAAAAGPAVQDGWREPGPDDLIQDTIPPADWGVDDADRLEPTAPLPLVDDTWASGGLPREDKDDWADWAPPGAAPAAPQTDAWPADPAPVQPALAEDDFRADLVRFAATNARPPATDAPPSPATARRAAQGFDDPDAVAARQDAIDARDVLPGSDEALDVPNEADEPGFMRQARRQAFWRTPAMRAVLGLLAVLLTGLLAVQWAVHERDQIAASRPELAPWLAQLCEPLGCTVAPLRRIDAVVIDSSTLARRLGSFYAFDVVIKNTAALPVALPALELSLTDTRDQVIARRVFLQQDLPGAPALLPPQSSVPLSLRLAITDAGAIPMAGYRALVFYP